MQGELHRGRMGREERRMRLIDADALHIDFDRYVEYIRRLKKGRKLKTEIAIFLDCKGAIDNAPTVDAIPIEYIQKEIEELEESLDFYGSIGEYDALRIDAMYQHDALTGLLRRWKAERKDNE